MSRVYIYEFIEDFQCAEAKTEKQDIIREFCDRLWRSLPRRKSEARAISFSVASSIKDEYKKLFEKYNRIEYMGYRSRTQSDDSFVILKQGLNNIYENMCDPDICSTPEYINLLRAPRRLYYDFFQNPNAEADPAAMELEIQGCLAAAEKVKQISAARKVKMSWEQYKRFVERKMFRIFENYRVLDWTCSTPVVLTDFIDDDHYAVSYIMSSINGYIKHERFEHLGVRRGHKLIPCPNCGAGLIEANGAFQKCVLCRPVYQKQQTKELKCIDCGEKFVVGAKSRRARRCPSCYRKYRKEQKANYERNRRNAS